MRVHRGLWEGLGIVLLVLLVYGGSLDNSFHFDDDHSIVKNQNLQSLISIPRSFVDAGTFSGDPQYGLMYRPMLVSSLVVNYAISGLAPWSYHLFNVLLHAAVCLSVLAWLRRWQPALARSAGVVVALLAVHPINSQIVNYISARAGIGAALGVIGACLAAEACRNSTRFGGTLALHVGALLSKSTAIVLVPLLALRAAGAGSPRKWRAPLSAAFISSALYLVAATATKFLGPSLSQLVRPLDVQIMTQSKAIVYYLWLLAIPANLSVIHDFHIAWEPTITVLAAACLLGSVTALALIAWIRHQYAAAYGVLWFLGGLGVTFLMPLHVIISEHRLYLSGAGAALFGLCIVGARPPRGHRVIWTVAIVLLGAMTMNRTAVWQSESSLWSAALRQAPTSSRVRANVGRSHFLAGDLAAAGEVWHAALALDPQNTVILLSLGSLEEDRGNLDLAQAFYRRALTSDPESGPANRQLGMSLARHGETPQALPLLEKAVALDPNAAALTGLAVVRRRLGDLQGARLSLEAALLIDPEHVDALVNLGGLHQEEAMRDRSVPSTGLDAARKIYERVLRMDPAHQEALLNLGELLGYLGEDAAAVETYRQLTTAHPGLVTAHTGLSDALARAGDLPAATRAMEVALGLDSTDASVWAELGGLQARTQQFARAAKALERARQLGDARPQILYNLAEILVVLGQAEWGQGNLDLARHHWTSALSHYRQLPEYRRSGERVTELERRLR